MSPGQFTSFESIVSYCSLKPDSIKCQQTTVRKNIKTTGLKRQLEINASVRKRLCSEGSLRMFFLYEKKKKKWNSNFFWNIKIAGMLSYIQRLDYGSIS